MKRLLLLSFISLTISPWVFAESVEDQQITHLLSDIDRSSEKGDFETVQIVRMRLADYAALIGRYDLACRQYELMLAARPGRAAGMIRVVVVDDEPMVCAHLRTILGSAPDIEVVDEAHDGAAGVEAVVRSRPDVVLMDLRSR